MRKVFQWVFVMAAATTFQSASAQTGNSQINSIDEVLAASQPPNKTAFREFHSNGSYIASGSKIDPFSYPKKELQCGSNRLVPTNASQVLKEYHINYWGNYDVTKLKATDSACRMKTSTPNSEGLFRCLVPDTFQVVILSNTYQDDCGNYYRGYWFVSFLKKHDNMGTLVAKGQTIYQDQNSQIQNDFIDGHTYAVDSSDFMFLSEIHSGDAKKIARELQRELKYTHNLKSDGTFVPKNK